MIGTRLRLLEVIMIVQMAIPGQADIGGRNPPICPGKGQKAGNRPRITATEGEIVVQLLQRNQQGREALLPPVRNQFRRRRSHDLRRDDQIDGSIAIPVPGRLGCALDALRSRPGRGGKKRLEAEKFPDQETRQACVPSWAIVGMISTGRRGSVTSNTRMAELENPRTVMAFVAPAGWNSRRSLTARIRRA